MAITLKIRIEHLPVPNVFSYASLTSSEDVVLLAPNLPHKGTVKSTLKSFIRSNLSIPEQQQQIIAPVFTRLPDTLPVEDVYKKYACQADKEICDLFVDEDNLVFFARENGKTLLLPDDARLHDYNILDKSVVQLRKAPQPLPGKGGRMFVETKDGILPLLGISPHTRISALKEAIEKHTGVPKSQQLLSSIGRVMHDDLYIKDFDGVHAIHEDSIVDLTVSGDKNLEQAHKRMLITVKVAGHEDFGLIVQGRTAVQRIMEFVETRTGIPQWQQRISFSGKTLQEKKTLAEYFVSPDSILHVTVFSSPFKSSFRPGTAVQSSEIKEEDAEYTPAARKLKLVRTSKSFVNGTLIIPVLTTDNVGDLRRKVKRSLRPLEVVNSLAPPKGPGGKSKFSTPRGKLFSTPEKFSTPRESFNTPQKSPQSCYKTPRGGNQQMEYTPSRGSKPSSARRLLRFGGANESFANENSVEEKISKALVRIESTGGVVQGVAAAEKKGIGAWLKQIKGVLQ